MKSYKQLSLSVNQNARFYQSLLQKTYILLIFLLASGSMAGQVTILGNYSSTNDLLDSRIGKNYSVRKSVKFTMPAGSDYTISSLKLRLCNVLSGGDPLITIRYDDAGGNDPGSLHSTFINPTFTTDVTQDYIFTTATAQVLTANTTYWIAVGHADFSGFFCWKTNYSFITPTGLATFGCYKIDDGLGSSIASHYNNFELLGISTLPVELTQFSAKKQSKNVVLNWETGSEKNNKGFEIQRSPDGKEWEKIGFVAGNGTTQMEQTYSYTDEMPYNGENYYRLKQIDFDDAYEYSDIKTVSMKAIQTKPLTLFPNPVIDQLTIFNGEGQAMIYNTLGQLVKQLDINNATFNINTSDLPKGQYILNIQNENGATSIQRFVKH